MFRKKNKPMICLNTGKPIRECTCAECEQSNDLADEYIEEINNIAQFLQKLLGPDRTVIVASREQMEAALHEHTIRQLPGMEETDELLPHDINIYKS